MFWVVSCHISYALIIVILKPLYFIYSFNYDYHHEELCNLESRQLFGVEMNHKVVSSEVKMDPSISPFIRNRLDVCVADADYDLFLDKIKYLGITLHDFVVEYLVIEGDVANKATRRARQKDVGYCIYGRPDFKNPLITYAICYLNESWCFGILHKEDITWHRHRQKPHSFSNSIGTIIAKTLVSVASQGHTEVKLLDACCGVGTVMLEACIAGFRIAGCDINPRAYHHALHNLKFYDYEAELYHSDIKDLTQTYDTAIIDLPYNLYSLTTDNIATHIITSAAARASRLVVVSIADIEPVITAAGLRVVDYATVVKRGKSLFTRKIWVCEPQ